MPSHRMVVVGRFLLIYPVWHSYVEYLSMHHLWVLCTLKSRDRQAVKPPGILLFIGKVICSIQHIFQ